MKKWKGLYIPDGEAHLPAWIKRSGKHEREGKLTYQYRKYDAAMSYIGKARRAIDVGAFIGQWSYVMSLDFDQVEAFEPMAAHRECWEANMKGRTNANLYDAALGNASGVVQMKTYTRNSFGDTRVCRMDECTSEREKVPLTTLDTYHFEDVDLIKIDCEGYEAFVVQGAEQTLLRCKPVVVVEQKVGHGSTYGLADTMAVAYLLSLGAVIRDVLSGDYIMSW